MYGLRSRFAGSRKVRALRPPVLRALGSLSRHPGLGPSFTVIEVATGECHGTFDSEADVALCLAFAKLSRDQVEVISDASPMATFTGWE